MVVLEGQAYGRSIGVADRRSSRWRPAEASTAGRRRWRQLPHLLLLKLHQFQLVFLDLLLVLLLRRNLHVRTFHQCAHLEMVGDHLRGHASYVFGEPC